MEPPEKEIKMACLEAALRTQTIDKDNLMTHSLDGPDKILEAAKKYYVWIKRELENGKETRSRKAT